MAAALVRGLLGAFHRCERAIVAVLQGRFPPDAYCYAGIQEARDFQGRSEAAPPFSWDGLLWAVPRTRRTIEKRMKRKYGSPEYVWKMLDPKNTLRVCNVCGDDHEVGVLCPTCYKKVMDETKQMQDKIESELGLNPDDKQVVVLYEGEKESKPEEFFEGKRIVEMPKPRPAWFSKNLLQESTQPAATSTDVKPTNLS